MLGAVNVQERHLFYGLMQLMSKLVRPLLSGKAHPEQAAAAAVAVTLGDLRRSCFCCST